MGTKTISLSEDAYERLKAAKRGEESFSDVVRRLAPGVRLTDFVGALEEDTADKLEATVAERRRKRSNKRRARARRIADALDEPDE